MPSTAPLDMAPLYGAQLILLVLCWTLWGSGCVQVWNYYMNYKSDALWMKLMVLSVWLSATIQILLIFSSVWRAFIIEYGNFEFALVVAKEQIYEFVAVIFVTITTQSFFVHRIYMFANHAKIVYAVFTPLALAEAGFCVAWIISANKEPSAIELANDPHVTTIMIGVMSVICAIDSGIAAGTTLVLRRNLLHSEFKRTNGNAIQNLILYSVNTGSWTSLFAILTLILYIRDRQDLWFLIFNFGICPLYLITLMANLNARNHIRSKRINDQSPSSGSVSKLGTLVSPEIAQNGSLNNMFDVEAHPTMQKGAVHVPSMVALHGGRDPFSRAV